MNENRIGLYIDFDNYYAGLLDTLPNVLYINDEKAKDEIENSLNKNIPELLQKLTEYFKDKINKENNHQIIYVKSFSDYNKVPYNKSINIIDILHKYGIKTFYPYIRKNKDMSDRALIISIIEDIFFKQREKQIIDSLILLTGDIDYLPLIDFFVEYSTINFYLLTFKNRFNKSYNDIFYMNDKIIFIDDLFGINSEELEYNKKYKILSNKIFEYKNKLASRFNHWLNRDSIEKIIKDINKQCCLKLELDKAKRIIEKLIEEGKLKKEEVDLSNLKRE